MPAWPADLMFWQQRSVGFVGVLFAMSALWLWHARRRGLYAQRSVWMAFGVEALQVAAILVPAWIGGWAPVMMAVALGVCGAQEARGAALRAWPHLGWPAPVAVLLVGVGFCAYAWLALLPQGFLWVLVAYGVAEAHDVAAFMVGAAMGRTPLAPFVSPGKTWEGEAAGLLAGALFAAVLWWMLPPVRVISVLAWVPCILLAGVLGDLAASWLKRSARQKDFSARVPTQGGVLDLYDAWVAVAPVAAALYVLVHR